MTAIKALAFDVGGSVFDWKGSVISVLQNVAQKYPVALDEESFAMEWRLAMFMLLGKLHKG